MTNDALSPAMKKKQATRVVRPQPTGLWWRPIAEKPPNGEYVLTWIPDARVPSGGQIDIYALHHGRKWKTEGGSGWEAERWLHDGNMVMLRREPTHWMPLPSAPSSAAAPKEET